MWKVFVPVHLASCSQVALWASRHFWPALISWQPLQQGEFLSLHMAPTLRLRLQNLSQQGSESSEPKRPASHSSLPSTRKLPQKDSSGSVKQRPALASNTARIERSEQGENLWTPKEKKIEIIICKLSHKILSILMSSKQSNPYKNQTTDNIS